MKRLPASLDDLRGLRYAAWVRESTAGQFDRYGPEAQRENVARFVERYGLVDSGVEFVAAESGRTVWRSEAMTRMVEAARAGQFDVLVVGYFDRWQRNLRRTLELVEDELHPNGVAWAMADRRLVSSDRNDWDEMIREAHEAQRYSTRLSERISDGYAAKFRRMSDQGGHAPWGFRRIAVGPEGHEQWVLQPDAEAVPAVLRLFERYATGTVSIEQLGREFDMPDRTVNDILKNPVYAGLVRYKGDTSKAPWNPPVPGPLWEQVQGVLARKARHGGSRRPSRPDLLRGLLRCVCGQRVRTDGTSGTPPIQRKLHPRHRECPEWGDQATYSSRHYDAVIVSQVSGLKVDDATIADVVRVLAEPEPKTTSIDRFRSERERRRLALDFAAGRLDVADFQRSIEALGTSPEDEPATQAIDAGEVVARLRDFAATWATLGDLGERGHALRAELVGALYQEIVVRGPEFVSATLTPAAYAQGFALALPERGKVVLARPTGVERAGTTFHLPIVGAREWRSLARRTA
jgi:DNA invertase Pin-like site-specific DNA recombinase